MRVLPITFHGLPFVAFTERDKLPSICGVYFVMADRQLLYVGSAKDIRARWKRHHQAGAAAKAGATKIAWMQVRLRDLWTIEKTAIIERKPPLNRQRLERGYQRTDKSIIEYAILRHYFPNGRLRFNAQNEHNDRATG